MVKRKFVQRGDYRNVVVSWGWTAEARKAARAAEIELWDFRQMVREIDGSFRLEGDRFTGETRRTIAVLSYSLDDLEWNPSLSSRDIIIASQDYWFQSEPYTHTWALIDKALPGRFCGCSATMAGDGSNGVRLGRRSRSRSGAQRLFILCH